MNTQATLLKFRVKLNWIHGVDSVRAKIPFGEVYIKQNREGKWQIEISGQVLRAKPRHKDRAMEHATNHINTEYEFWLETKTNAKEYWQSQEEIEADI